MAVEVEMNQERGETAVSGEKRSAVWNGPEKG